MRDSLACGTLRTRSAGRTDRTLELKKNAWIKRQEWGTSFAPSSRGLRRARSHFCSSHLILSDGFCLALAGAFLERTGVHVRELSLMVNGKRPCLTCFNRFVHVRSSKPLSRYLTLQ